MALRRACQQGFAQLRLIAAAAEGAAACSLHGVTAPNSTAAASAQRWYSRLPEDIARAAQRAKFPSRRRQPSTAPAAEPPTSSTATAGGAAEGKAPAAASLAQPASQQEAAQLVSAWMFPWERRQMEGGKLRTWEKLYWGVFVAGMALFLFNRLPRDTKQEKVDEEKEARKQEVARMVAAGASLLKDEEDPFEGLTPEEIQQYVKQTTGVSSPGDDPFEGMSPEEINDYMAKHSMPATTSV